MSKVKKISLLLFAICVLILGFIYFKQFSDKTVNKKNEQVEVYESYEGEAEYKKNINGFITLDSSDFVFQLKKLDAKILYIGRGTCPYCQDFASKLAKANAELDNIKVFYLSTEDFSEEIEDFVDSNNIISIPQLFKVSQGIITGILEIQPETSVEDIKKFIKD